MRNHYLLIFLRRQVREREISRVARNVCLHTKRREGAELKFIELLELIVVDTINIIRIFVESVLNCFRLRTGS